MNGEKESFRLSEPAQENADDGISGRFIDKLRELGLSDDQMRFLLENPSTLTTPVKVMRKIEEI